MDQKRIHLGKAVIVKQFMDDEMAEYAVTEADGALECIFAEKVNTNPFRIWAYAHTTHISNSKWLKAKCVGVDLPF